MSHILHARIERSVCPAYLLEPTPGVHCPFASGLGMNIFAASMPFAQFLAQFKFCNQKADLKLLQNLATMILAARDLNEHRGKHRLLQTSSQPMSEQFQNSVDVWNHPVSLPWKNGTLL